MVKSNDDKWFELSYEVDCGANHGGRDWMPWGGGAEAVVGVDGEAARVQDHRKDILF